MFWKKKKESLPIAPSFEFNQAMSFVKDALRYGQYSGDVIAEKIAVLDYTLEVVRSDFCYSMISDVIYKYPKFPIEIWNFMPCAVFDKNGKRIEATDEKFFVKIDFSKDCVISVPWELERITQSTLDIFHEGFVDDRTNNISYYYELMDICFMENGNHHVAAAIAAKKGTMFASVYHTEKVFEHMTTDGEKWYNAHTGNALDNVFDFRIALLYEISKMKHGLSMQLNGSETMTTETGALTPKDVAEINAMADFHGITKDEAYGFWREGNFDCLVDPDGDEDEDEDFEEQFI